MMLFYSKPDFFLRDLGVCGWFFEKWEPYVRTRKTLFWENWVLRLFEFWRSQLNPTFFESWRITWNWCGGIRIDFLAFRRDFKFLLDWLRVPPPLLRLFLLACLVEGSRRICCMRLVMTFVTLGVDIRTVLYWYLYPNVLNIVVQFRVVLFFCE